MEKILINYQLKRSKSILYWRQLQNKRKNVIINLWKRKVEKYMELMESLMKIYKPRHRSIGYHYRENKVGINLLTALNDRFKDEFRISQQHFIWLCEILRTDLQIKPNPLSTKQKKASVEEKVAITIYKLKSCAEYQVVGNIFGYSKSTIHKFFYEVIRAIIKLLSKRVIKFPEGEECERISRKFEGICGIPQITGAIDGTHIPVTVYNKGRTDFINRKGWASIVLQAVVDDKYMFRDISCKFPGNVHDATVLKGSQLYKDAEVAFPVSDFHINSIRIPYFLVGDPAYPLLPWILKDYPGTELERKKALFNLKLNTARVKVEQAFGILKSCWRIISRRSEIDVDFMPQVVAACCILHNIFLQEYDPNNFFPEESEAVGIADRPIEKFVNVNARIMRDTIAEMLLNKFE